MRPSTKFQPSHLRRCAYHHHHHHHPVSLVITNVLLWIFNTPTTNSSSKEFSKTVGGTFAGDQRPFIRFGTMSRMMLEIVAAFLTTSGWVLVTSTLPTEYWKVYSLAGTVILTTPAYFSNLWKLCITDSTGVSDCKDFPSMLALEGLPFPFSFLLFFCAF